MARTKSKIPKDIHPGECTEVKKFIPIIGDTDLFWIIRLMNKYSTFEFDPCIDNHRYSTGWSEGSRRNNKYEISIDNGCCGFFDQKFKAPSGKYYWIGFNYGH